MPSSSSSSNQIPKNVLTIKEQQKCLSLLGLYKGKIDGVAGHKTREACIEFCELEDIDLDSHFHKHLYKKIADIAPKDYRGKEGLLNELTKLSVDLYLTRPEQIAYIMATAEHESAGKYESVRESFYMTKAKRDRYLKSKPYYPYYGRGLVQLTWEYNYQKYSDLLNVDMVADPDLALRPDYSLFILVHGMKTGTFTSRCIEDYINEDKCDFNNARRVVNGKDRASHIASLAKKWLPIVENKLIDSGIGIPKKVKQKQRSSKRTYKNGSENKTRTQKKTSTPLKQEKTQEELYKQWQAQQQAIDKKSGDNSSIISSDKSGKKTTQKSAKKKKKQNSKPAIKSKIIHTAAVTLVSFIAARYGLEGHVEKDVISTIEMLIVSIGTIATAYFRKYKTDKPILTKSD